MSDDTGRVRCCIAGGGPAGMMLGTLLARAGIDVVVLEKHADFLRDFRGDTIHPSTLEIMHELGWLDEFLQLPHQKVTELRALVGSLPLTIADFRHLPTRCKFIAFMPQWDFLNFLAEYAGRFPQFRLRMGAEVTALIEDAGRITGARATRTPISGAVLDDLALDGLRARLGLRLRGRDLELRLFGLLLVVVLAGDRVLELAHPAAERLAQLGEPLGPEDE